MRKNTRPVTARFYQLIPGIPKPRRADRSADGMIPMRAYRYCEALTAASAFGWYFYPPLNFSLLLEGDEIFWTYEGADGCYPLGGAQFPGFSRFFEDRAPDAIKRLPPPFLTASRDPGVVQIWSGYLGWTAPKWALLLRKPVNIPITKPYEHFEGLIETNSWFGPLFTNIRLKRSDVRVDFHKTQPLFQAQPVLRECYDQPSYEVLTPDDMSAADWQRFGATLVRNNDNMRLPGHYAVDIRKRLHADAAD
ncbi:MAG TPA: hypothetical protein VMF86_14045 [Stellaceae bacterium]|nr:hypothetical protein [Stellaceae bacterium]